MYISSSCNFSVSPESSFIGVVKLFAAPFTFVQSLSVSSAQLTERRRVIDLVCSRDTASVEEICQTWSHTHTNTQTHTRLSSFLYVQCVCAYMYCMYSLHVSYPLRFCSPSLTCSPGLWSIPKAYSSRLFGLSRCGSSFFLPGCWYWWQSFSSPQQLRSRWHRYLRRQQHRR